jgi:gliding motility-associated-like protein
VEVDIRRHIYVPNVFHPDGDAENNRFLIFGRGVVEIKDLSVFDRWGNMVWRGEHLAANDQSTGWDGNMRNKKVSPGVYVWQAVIVFPDGVAEIYSGDVTVIW